jgi:uncharacterized protein
MQIVLIGLVVYVATGILVTIFQRHMIYHPSRVSSEMLEGWAAADGFDRWRNAAGENIGWKRLAPNRPATGQVLVVHGNAGSAVHRVDYANAIQRAAPLDVFILEYPGYGDRPGAPSEKSLFHSADDAMQLLDRSRPIYLLGESLGTGVASYLAGKWAPNVTGVLLIAPFNNLTVVGQHHMPVFPVRWMLRDRFESEKHLRRYQGPLAVILATQDRVVPAKFGRRLFEDYHGPKRLWVSDESSHETIHDQTPEFWRELIAFWHEEATNPLPHSRKGF